MNYERLQTSLFVCTKFLSMDGTLDKINNMKIMFVIDHIMKPYGHIII